MERARRGFRWTHESAGRFQYKGFSRLWMRRRASARRIVSGWSIWSAKCHVRSCGGSRLREDAAASRFPFGEDRPALTIGELVRCRSAKLALFQELQLTPRQQQVAGELLREVRDRLRFLVDVGLDYLTLGRAGPTLSGGEIAAHSLGQSNRQRFDRRFVRPGRADHRPASARQRRLFGALQRLRDLGNTLILVEHDREVIAVGRLSARLRPRRWRPRRRNHRARHTKTGHALESLAYGTISVR